MTIGELIELAANVAMQAPLLMQSGRGIAPEAVAQYWSASKCRQQRWAQALKELSAGPGDATPPKKNGGAAGERSAIDAASVIHEIFASEVLARVWTAVVALDDRRRRTGESEPIVRSVYLGHLEARRRALTLLVRGRSVEPQQAVELNRWRRRTERWNDLLMGYLLVGGDVSEFAFDAGLAAEFARDFRERPEWRTGGAAWAVVIASLKADCRMAAATSPNHDLNLQIGTAVLGCFGAGVFDFLGLPRSAWTARLLHIADSTRGLIEQLLAAECIGSP